MAASRLQLASRIQFSAQRALNVHVDVSEMLLNAHYAEEILQLCRGMVAQDLRRLAEEFEQASRDQRSLRRAPGTRPRDLAHPEVHIRRPNGSPQRARSLPQVQPAPVALAKAAVPAAAPAPRAPVSLSELATQVRDRLQIDHASPWWPVSVRRLAGV